MTTFVHSLRGQMSTPLYELGGKCPHMTVMQFLGRGQMSEGANVWLQNLTKLIFNTYRPGVLFMGHRQK